MISSSPVTGLREPGSNSEGSATRKIPKPQLPSRSHITASNLTSSHSSAWSGVSSTANGQSSKARASRSVLRRRDVNLDPLPRLESDSLPTQAGVQDHLSVISDAEPPGMARVSCEGQRTVDGSPVPVEPFLRSPPSVPSVDRCPERVGIAKPDPAAETGRQKNTSVRGTHAGGDRARMTSQSCDTASSTTYPHPGSATFPRKLSDNSVEVNFEALARLWRNPLNISKQVPGSESKRSALSKLRRRLRAPSSGDELDGERTSGSESDPRYGCSGPGSRKKSDQDGSSWLDIFQSKQAQKSPNVARPERPNLGKSVEKRPSIRRQTSVPEGLAKVAGISVPQEVCPAGGSCERNSGNRDRGPTGIGSSQARGNDENPPAPPKTPEAGVQKTMTPPQDVHQGSTLFDTDRSKESTVTLTASGGQADAIGVSVKSISSCVASDISEDESPGEDASDGWRYPATKYPREQAVAPALDSGKAAKRDVSKSPIASSKKNAEFHNLFPQVPESERLIADFGCAYQREILAQGRLYVTEERVCFKAKILKWVTSLDIPLQDVVAIEKKNTALVIPNAIQITTRQHRHFFASFLFREVAYCLIMRLWGPCSPHGIRESAECTRVPKTSGKDPGCVSRTRACVKTTPGNLASDGEAVTLTSEEESVTSFISRPRVLLTGDRYDAVLCDIVTELSLADVFALVFGSEAFSEGGMMEKLYKSRGAASIECGDWTTNPRGYWARSIHFTMPVRIPMGPKQTRVHTTDEIVFHDPESRISLKTKTITPDVPSGPDFALMSKTCLLKESPSSCRLVVTSRVRWYKPSCRRGAVEKSVLDGHKEHWQQVADSLEDMKALESVGSPRRQGQNPTKSSARSTPPKAPRSAKSRGLRCGPMARSAGDGRGPGGSFTPCRVRNLRKQVCRQKTIRVLLLAMFLWNAGITWMLTRPRAALSSQFSRDSDPSFRDEYRVVGEDQSGGKCGAPAGAPLDEEEWVAHLSQVVVEFGTLLRDMPRSVIETGPGLRAAAQGVPFPSRERPHEESPE